MKVRYTPSNLPDGRVSMRPMLRVEISKGSNLARVSVLLDTGADLCVFHDSLKPILGLDALRPKKKVDLLGIGARKPVIAPVYRLRIRVPQLVGASVHVDAAFTNLIPDDAGLLGNREFLSRFKVEFHDGQFFVIKLGDSLRNRLARRRAT